MDQADDWPFDQEPNVAAITSKLVVEGGHPIRHVHHYEDDLSWSFLGGTLEEQGDLILVHMDMCFTAMKA